MGIIEGRTKQQGAGQTPLQAKLEEIATDIGKLGMIAAYITILTLFVRFWIDYMISGYDWSKNAGTYVGYWF